MEVKDLYLWMLAIISFTMMVIDTSNHLEISVFTVLSYQYTDRFGITRYFTEIHTIHI